MPVCTDPLDAVVSILLKNSDEFLGSGAFIAPRWILTAKHVVKNKTPDNLWLGLVKGENRTPVYKIYCHDDEAIDISLIELEKEFCTQEFVSVNWGRSDYKGATVAYYAVYPHTKSRVPATNHQVIEWESGKYKVDFRPRKGFSGGIATVDRIAVGIISERYVSEQESIFIPCYAAYEWLCEIVIADEREKYFPRHPAKNDQPQPPDDAKQYLPVHPVTTVYQAQPLNNELAQTVRDEIRKLLKRPRLRSLKQELQERAVNSTPENLLVPEDAEFDFNASIDNLKAATKNCLEVSTDSVPELKRYVTEILGWLVLLAISEQWLEKNADLGQRLMDATLLEMPTATSAGTETLVARFRNHSAKFELSKNRVLGSHQLGWDAFLETGVTSKDYLLELKRFIWKKVHGYDAPQPFTRTDEDDLKTTLEDRYK
ncbi:MAG: trypsin-like serine protease, partial [Candidatus Competibacteraceae bacterium]|nr:trypsin-like serine protease [Candidatus Competibacteraceae bacterium]